MTSRKPPIVERSVASPASATNGALPVVRPRIGLALGGGGARGLAHIVMLEAFDELGIKPAIMSGTSIGAIYAAAYASGISGQELRVHTKDILSPRFGLVRDLFAARSQTLQRLYNPFTRSAILDPNALLDLVMPKHVKANFTDLEIPLHILASDFYEQEPVVFTAGLVRTAVAASMALPVIFHPVVRGTQVLIDGGMTNPLPFDVITPHADIVVAIDVSGAPVPDPKRATPTAFEALFASAFLFERSIIKEKLKASQPDILISAGTSQFQVLDFLKFDEIIAAAEPAKERLKSQLERILSVETLAQIESPLATNPQTSPVRARRGYRLLSRRRSSTDGD